MSQSYNPAAREHTDTNIVFKVLEYLTKKGYARTEQTLRQESSHVDKDGRPVVDRVEDLGNEKYTKALILLSNWIETGLDIYKVKHLTNFDRALLTTPSSN